MVIGEINLKENELKIGHMKIHHGDREMFRCNGIEIKFPKHVLPIKFDTEHDVSI